MNKYMAEGSLAFFKRPLVVRIPRPVLAYLKMMERAVLIFLKRSLWLQPGFFYAFYSHFRHFATLREKNVDKRANEQA